MRSVEQFWLARYRAAIVSPGSWRHHANTGVLAAWGDHQIAAERVLFQFYTIYRTISRTETILRPF